MSDTTLSYCGQEVRRHDNDRFLTALFAPAELREDLFALYAFNTEIARTREVVTEPMLGQIRLQWWRESVEGIYEGQPRRHEVVTALATAVERGGLSRPLLERLVDAREADLDDAPPKTLACLVNYAESTSSPLVQLALQAADARGEAAMAAGRHVGIAYSLTGILRSVPHLARAHRTRLPADLLAKHGVSEPRLFDLKPQESIRELVREVAEVARSHLAEARSRRAEVPKAALPALLPAVLAELYLDVLAKAGHDPFAPRVALAHPLRHAKLAWRSLLGRW